MAQKKSAYDLLLEAGCVRPGILNEKELAIVNQLSDDEVRVLIKLREKLGTTDEGRHVARPDFPL